VRGNDAEQRFRLTTLFEDDDPGRYLVRLSASINLAERLTGKN
jgi:hypothetical protein